MSEKQRGNWRLLIPVGSADRATLEDLFNQAPFPGILVNTILVDNAQLINHRGEVVAEGTRAVHDYLDHVLEEESI